MRGFARTIILIAIPLLASASYAAPSTLTETEAPSLQENNFADVVKKENCIVMYYNADVKHNDEKTRTLYGMTSQQIGDLLMKGMIAVKERTVSTVKFYKVNWKGFSAVSRDKIRSDLGCVSVNPPSPSFAAYMKNGTISYQIKGVSRPDIATWLINEIMDEYIPSSKWDKGVFLYEGWAVTDTNSKYINVVDVRKESLEFNGKVIPVQINSYRSQVFEDFSCTYERIYSAQGKLIGSLETCGKYGKVGYFDYDRTGKMQYKVKYK